MSTVLICCYYEIFMFKIDLIVNILTNHAVNNREIKVFGGSQARPNIHIGDVTDLYVKSLQWEDQKIDGNVFNAGYETQTVYDIAESVKSQVGDDVGITSVPTDDNRSYRISSEKIKRELGFAPALTTEDAVKDLMKAYDSGLIPDPMNASLYYNIKTMQNLGLR